MRNKPPSQLRRWHQVDDVINGELRASDNKERALAVAVDLCSAIVVDVKAAGEGVECHQGLGQGLLESDAHVEQVDSGGNSGAVEVDCWNVASVGQTGVEGGDPEALLRHCLARRYKRRLYDLYLQSHFAFLLDTRTGDEERQDWMKIYIQQMAHYNYSPYMTRQVQPLIRSYI